MSEAERVELLRAELVEYVPVILQRMPGRKYRIDPVVIGEMVAWLTAVRKPFERIASQGWRGADEAERARRRGEREYGRQMLRAIDAIATSLLETRDADDIDAAIQAWRQALLTDGKGGK